MDPRQRVAILTVVIVVTTGLPFAGAMWSIQNRAERVLDEWARRGGYRVVRKTRAVTRPGKGPFRWTGSAFRPVLNVGVEDRAGAGVLGRVRRAGRGFPRRGRRQVEGLIGARDQSPNARGPR